MNTGFLSCEDDNFDKEQNETVDLNNLSDNNIISVATPLEVDPDDCNVLLGLDVFCSGGVSPDAISVHNNLLGLQGGTLTARYHLTPDQWQAVENADAPSATNPFITTSAMPAITWASIIGKPNNGNFIFGSPLEPQVANISLDGGIAITGQIYAGNALTLTSDSNYMYINFGENDRFSYLKPFNQLVWDNKLSVGSFSIANEPELTTSNYSLLVRDNVNTAVRRVIPGETFIFASPVERQSANINITGTTTTDQLVTGLVDDPQRKVVVDGNGLVLGESGGINFHTAGQLYYTASTDHYFISHGQASLSIQDGGAIVRSSDGAYVLYDADANQNYIRNLPLAGTEQQAAEFRVNAGTIGQLAVGNSFNEPAGNFHVRGTTFLDANSSTGGVNFYGVAIGNTGGINVGSAVEDVALASNHSTIVVDNNTGLLKRVATGGYIIATPAVSQTANISITGDIAAHQINTSGAIYSNEFLGVGNYYLTQDNSSISEATIGRSVTIRYNTGQTGRIDSLNLTGDRTYYLPDKDGTFAVIEDLDGFIQASPATPQSNFIHVGNDNDNIRIDGSRIELRSITDAVLSSISAGSAFLDIKGSGILLRTSEDYAAAIRVDGVEIKRTSDDAKVLFEGDVDLSGYVTIGTAQTITGTKTFNAFSGTLQGHLDAQAGTLYNPSQSGKLAMWDGSGYLGGNTLDGYLGYSLNDAFNAKANDSDVVHKTGAETINGVKTFNSTILARNGAEFNVVDSSGAQTSVRGGEINIYSDAAGLNGFRIRPSDKRITFIDGGQTTYLTFTTPTSPRDIVLPNNSGTVALLSDLSGFVDMTTNQTIGGTKTFSNTTFIGVNGSTNFTALELGSVSVYGASSTLGRLFPTNLQFINSTFSNTLTQATLTANRNVVIPDKSGTLAMLSDITGGGGTWGSITGTLSAQTDLQSALNAKANLSGGNTFDSSLQTFGTTGTGRTYVNNTGVVVGSTSDSKAAIINVNGFSYRSATSTSISLQFPVSTVNRVVNMQDKDGTVAYLDDIVPAVQVFVQPGEPTGGTYNTGDIWIVE